MGRFTLQGAIRYDHAWSYYPEQTVVPVRFFPTAVTYPRTTGVEGYHDLWPRGGVAIDVFGTGKTSVKVNFGRYLEAAQNGGIFTALNPTGRLSIDHHPHVDRQRSRLGRRLQSQQPGSAESGDDRQRGHLRRQRHPQFRHRGVRLDARSERCCRDGACAPATGSGGRLCSRSCCRASRSKWDISAGGW